MLMPALYFFNDSFECFYMFWGDSPLLYVTLLIGYLQYNIYTTLRDRAIYYYCPRQFRIIIILY